MLWIFMENSNVFMNWKWVGFVFLMFLFESYFVYSCYLYTIYIGDMLVGIKEINFYI